VALKEHVKIQAENVEDAITRIEDIMDWEDTAEYKLNSKESLWTSEY
jgi:hypothetical protein